MPMKEWTMHFSTSLHAMSYTICTLIMMIMMTKNKSYSFAINLLYFHMETHAQQISLFTIQHDDYFNIILIFI